MFDELDKDLDSLIQKAKAAIPGDYKWNASATRYAYHFTPGPGNSYWLSCDDAKGRSLASSSGDTHEVALERLRQNMKHIIEESAERAEFEAWKASRTTAA